MWPARVACTCGLHVWPARAGCYATSQISRFLPSRAFRTRCLLLRHPFGFSVVDLAQDPVRRTARIFSKIHYRATRTMRCSRILGHKCPQGRLESLRPERNPSPLHRCLRLLKQIACFRFQRSAIRHMFGRGEVKHRADRPMWTGKLTRLLFTKGGANESTGNNEAGDDCPG